MLSIGGTKIITGKKIRSEIMYIASVVDRKHKLVRYWISTNSLSVHHRRRMFGAVFVLKPNGAL